MKTNIFHVGDIVTGSKDSLYGLTNQFMLAGEIIRIWDDGYITIRYLKGRDQKCINHVYTVCSHEFVLVKSKSIEFLTFSDRIK